MLGNIIIVFAVFLLLFMGFILFTPFHFIVNNQQQVYKIWWKGICSLEWEKDESGPGFFFKTWFYKKKLDLFKQADKAARVKKKKTPSGKKRKPALKKWATKIRRIPGTFKVHSFRVDLDTDDYVWNAYLTPVFYFIRGENTSFRVNYEGRIQVNIFVENRLIKLLLIML